MLLSEYSPKARLLELKTKASKMAKNIRCDENVLEEFAHGVLRLQDKKVLEKYFSIFSFHQYSGFLAVCLRRLHKLNYFFCSWKQLTPVQSWRSCTALVGHKVNNGPFTKLSNSMMNFQHNIYLLGGEEVDAESPTGSRTVNR